MADSSDTDRYLFRMIVLLNRDFGGTGGRRRISAVLSEPRNKLGMSDERIAAHLQKMASQLPDYDVRYINDVAQLINSHSLDWVNWLLFDLEYKWITPPTGLHVQLPDEIWISGSAHPDIPEPSTFRRQPVRPEY